MAALFTFLPAFTRALPGMRTAYWLPDGADAVMLELL